MNCSLPVWYDKFKTITLKTVIIPLEDAFIDYLQSDGIYLPKNSQTFVDNDDESWDGSNSNWDDDDGDNESYDLQDKSGSTDKYPDFPALELAIQSAILQLGGAVFPKLDWSSPKDAAWIAFGSSLKCTDVESIFLLLKSSDFIMHDLSRVKDAVQHINEAAGATGFKHHLVLREWYDLNPAMEFRCFVKNNRLVAISQRDYANYYEYLLEMQANLEGCIIAFYQTRLHEQFTESDYTFDIYINKNTTKAWLIDFNPWAACTDSLLFSWSEVSMETREFEFRMVESQSEADFNSSHQPAYALNSVPRDSLEISMGGAGSLDHMHQMIHAIKEATATSNKRP